VAEASVASISKKRKLEDYKLEDYVDPYEEASDPSSVEVSSFS